MSLEPYNRAELALYRVASVVLFIAWTALTFSVLRHGHGLIGKLAGGFFVIVDMIFGVVVLLLVGV